MTIRGTFLVFPLVFCLGSRVGAPLASTRRCAGELRTPDGPQARGLPRCRLGVRASVDGSGPLRACFPSHLPFRPFRKEVLPVPLQLLSSYVSIVLCFAAGAIGRWGPCRARLQTRPLRPTIKTRRMYGVFYGKPAAKTSNLTAPLCNGSKMERI